MSPEKISEILKNLVTCPDDIPDNQLGRDFNTLLNLFEKIIEDYRKIKEENQQLRDAINLLKGEDPKPKFPEKKKKKKNESSEKERKDREPPKKKKSKKKKDKIIPDRTELCPIDKSILPEDAKYHGCRPILVQEIIIKVENVEYLREVYYSPSQGKIYMGKLPPGIKGGYGPGIISLIYAQKHGSNVSEPKITDFLNDIGIQISQPTVSRFLTNYIDDFHQEKNDIVLAGLHSTGFQQIDDTGTKVNGESQYVQILCNPYYTAFFTVPKKDRLTVIDILLCGQERLYFFNDETFVMLKKLKVSNKVISQLQSEVAGKTLNEKEMKEVLKKLFPNPKKHKNIRKRIKEAGAIVAYKNQTDIPVIPILLSDNAPQFKLITEHQALCWIHDGRHYKKLYPIVLLNKNRLDDFRGQYWDYYAKLLVYKKNPTQGEAEELSKEFDKLFSTKTGYDSLDERIAKSKAKKSEQLLVLNYPELPLHNNNSERGARAEKRKQDVSLQTITEAGTKSKDTFLTIALTSRKLGVSFYKYIYDRASKNFNMPSLASIIEAKPVGNDCFDTS